ncbi:MAG: hypothetical protein ACI4LX_03010 [Treponema sp.]
MKFKNIFAIETAPCKTLLECLNSYSKVQLEILTDKMNLGDCIKKSATKKDRVIFLKGNILKRLDYLFDYLDSNAFLITAIFATEDDDDKKRVLTNFMEAFGEGTEEEVMNSCMSAIENGLMFLFAKDEDNPVFVVPDEIREKVLDLAALAKAKKYKPGFLHDFMKYCEVLSSLYGLCPLELFMQIYERDYPDCKIPKKNLNLFFERAALVSGNFCFEDDMLKTPFVETNFEEYIIKDRERFKPYIPTEEEIFEHYDFTDYDEENEAFQNIIRFFEKEKGDNDGYCEYIALDIIPLIKVHFSVQEVIEYIQENYGIISTEKSMKKFLSIYQELNNTSHLWSNWGHPPSSLFALNGEKKDAAYADDFLENLKKQKENLPHIELPENCVVPTDDEIKKLNDEFDKYWKNNGNEPAWHKNGDRVMSRIMKDIKSNINIFSKFPENVMNQLFDQWLASVYHENANCSNKFGNQKWKYYAFKIAEKLRDGLYTCLLSDGSPIVVASPGFDGHFKDDFFCCLTVLVDMGGWYLTYGPQLVWKGLEVRDIEVLAKSVASQTYNLKGLNGVVQFNPVPFWYAQQVANIPPVAHKGVPVVQCYAETRFLNDAVPDFKEVFAASSSTSDILKNWEHEVSEKNPSKFERWICNKCDYLGSCAVYHDKKNGTVLLFSSNEDLFDRAFAKLGQYFDQKHCETIKYSMPLASVIKNRKHEKLLIKFESEF